MAYVTAPFTDQTTRVPTGSRPSTQWLLPTVAVLLIPAVMISPFALDAFGGRDGEWERRSTIGQTYGAISALLAALALGAVAISVFLQRQETRATKAFSLRSIHVDLLKMAIDDAELRACLVTSANDGTVGRQHLYCNLLFSFWETRYVLGELRHEEIGGVASQLLATEPGYRFWTNEREYRFKYVDSIHALRFRKAFDEEYLAFSGHAPDH